MSSCSRGSSTGALPALMRVDEAPVQIDTDDVESLAGEHRREGSTELTQTNDRNLHGIIEKHSGKQKEYRRPTPEGSI